MNTKAKIFTLFLLSLIILSCLSGCNKATEPEKTEALAAEFSSQSKMFKRDGFSIIMDSKFEYQDSKDCSISAINGDLTFEAFYLEKYYFTEKNKDVTSSADALSYVNPGKDVQQNSLGLPYVEYEKVDSDGVNYTFYYVCISDSERYWMCTFFAPTSSFEGYRAHIMDYLDTIDAVYEEEQ